MEYRDRTLDYTYTTGTGPLTLSGTANGFRTAAAAFGAGDHDSEWVISHPTSGQWEVFRGTLNGASLTRTTVLASSNAGALVDFTPGRKEVRQTLPAATIASLMTAADIGGTVQGYDAALQSIAGLTIADNVILVGTGPDAFEAVEISANVYSLLGAADYAAMRSQLGLGTAALENIGAFDAAGVAAAAVSAHESDTTSVHGIADTSTLYRAGGADVAIADGGTGASDAATARGNLGLVIGTDVQPYAAQLASLAGLSYTGNASKVVRVNAGETAFELAAIAGTGDVVGPGSSTDNGIVRFNGTGGTSIQNSGVAIDDDDCLTALAVNTTMNVESNASTVTFDLAVSNIHKVGLTGSSSHTFALTNEKTGSGKVQPLAFIIEQAGSGGDTVVWWSGITWIDGSGTGAAQPTLSNTAGSIDIIGILALGGGVYLGFPITLQEV